MPQGAPYGGERRTVTSELGGRRFLPFPLDVGVGDALPMGPDRIGGGIDLSFAGLEPLEVPAVPVEVHLAEKLHALSFPRADGRINTRAKDLIDVMLLLQRGLPPMERVWIAVTATFERRDTHAIPERFELPLDACRDEYERYALELELGGFAASIAQAHHRLDDLAVHLRGEV